MYGLKKLLKYWKNNETHIGILFHNGIIRIFWNIKLLKRKSQYPIKDRQIFRGKQLVFKNYVDLTANILNKGRGISISDIYDKINNENLEIHDMKSNKLKVFMEVECGSNIQFCLSESKINLKLYIPHLWV